MRPAQVEEPEVFVHRESAEAPQAEAPAETPAEAPKAEATTRANEEQPEQPAQPATTDRGPLTGAPSAHTPAAHPAPEEYGKHSPDTETAETPAAQDEPAEAAGAAEESAKASAAEKPKSSSKKQRVSVPAWDDIIFGGRK